MNPFQSISSVSATTPAQSVEIGGTSDKEESFFEGAAEAFVDMANEAEKVHLDIMATAGSGDLSPALMIKIQEMSHERNLQITATGTISKDIVGGIKSVLG